MSNNRRSYEFTGESAESAIASGLEELGLTRTAVGVEVLEEAQNSFLGMGGREAKVRITILDSKNEDEGSTQSEEVEEAHAEESDAAETTDVIEEEPFDDLDELPDPELMDELELATDIVQSIVEGLELDIEVNSNLSVEDDLGKQVIELNLVGDDASKMIGPRGDVMASLQFVVRLMISQELHRRSNVTIDVDGFRQSKREGLSRLAMRMAQKVVNRQRPVTLEPMNPYERRLIHIALREDDAVTTQSVGEGAQRRVRILPAE
ncbi:MAG: RNA-binding cell elongation regulator Jag/EloR [Chloroflexota bacterium]